MRTLQASLKQGRKPRLPERCGMQILRPQSNRKFRHQKDLRIAMPEPFDGIHHTMQLKYPKVPIGVGCFLGNRYIQSSGNLPDYLTNPHGGDIHVFGSPIS
jgi:hypothetical protein